MTTYTIRPLDDLTIFHTPKFQRGGNPFRSSWSDTLKLLNRELGHLDGKDIVLELAVTAGDLRRDGMLRSRARVEHPGVRLSFLSKHGPMSYTCDQYVGIYSDDPPDWQINVRAIAKTLESLRAVDRYGATAGKQYAGFKELGAGSGATPMGGMTREQAVYVIDDYQPSDWSSRDRESAQLAYRRARAAAHPDRHGGDRTAWDAVEEAARVLGIGR